MNSNIRQSLFFTLLFVLLHPLVLKAQDYSTVHPSPNIGWSVASVRQEGQLYTGASRLELPIYELSVGRTKIPLGLNYLTKSVVVDQLPSWVGSGWNLAVGGQVSRVVNGRPDEMVEMKRRVSTVISGGSSSSTTYVIPTDIDFAYIANNHHLNSSSWATPNYLQNTLGALNCTEVNLLEYTAFYTVYPYTDSWVVFEYVPTYHRDFQPDEFNFSVGNVAGKFYLNHENKWICETTEGNYAVEPFFATDVMKSGRKVARMIYKFVITAPDGTKYTFGGSSSDYLKNVEFWRGPTWTATGDPFSNAFNVYANTYVPVCPTAWYITRIETPENQHIDFEYKKGAMQVTYSDAPQGVGNSTQFTRKYPGSIYQSLDEPWYLTKIKTSGNIEIEIVSETSTQLSSNQRIDNLSVYSSFLPQAEIAAELTNSNNNLLKVTEIKIKDGTELRKRFMFEYFENINERLKLKAFKEVAVTGSANDIRYSFEYNAGILPAYGAGKTDHFGFFNNQRYFTDNTTTAYSLSRADIETQYFASRQPDFTYAKYETLSKVTFPTGGYREYVYEPNDYSVKISQWPFATSSVGANVATGGIRIQKIIDYTGVGNKASEVEFIYKTAIAGSTSSGVFSVPTPKYTEDKSGGGYDFSTRSFIPFDRAVSHITYSTVFEKYADNSYTKHVFWNYDNGANDELPAYETASQVYVDGQSFTRHQYKRGLIKTSADYNSQGAEVKRLDVQYQHELDNYQRLIRHVRLNHVNSSGTGYKSTALPVYYFPNVVRSKTETLKFPSGDVVSKTDLSYDAYNNVVLSSSKNSKDQVVEAVYKYPYNFSDGNISNIYTRMVNKKLFNVIIEERHLVTKSGQQYLTSGTINNFSEYPGAVYLARDKYVFRTGAPIAAGSVSATQYSATTGQLSFDPKFNLNLSYHYNTTAKILQETSLNAPRKAFLWGYNGEYLVAKADNAENSATVCEIFYQGFEEESTAATLTPFSGRKYFSGDYQVPFSMPNTKSYRVNYHYLDNGVWKNMTKPYANNMVLSEGSAIDEVRVYPADAFISTYTYLPLVGMTSETDPNGITVFFEYDGLQRLQLVRDQNGNIIKTYEYKFKQP